VSTTAIEASTRERIITGAVELTTVSGWSSVTMARLAEHVGVSRQTVYNEVGAKPALAEAMVLDELGRFLAVVEDAFDRNPADLERALRAAVRAVLDRAHDSALLRAIVSSANGGDTGLLPPLTTDASSLLAAATVVLTRRLAAYDLAAAPDARRLAAAVDTVVRVVLSHVMTPGGSTRTTADDLAWAAHRLLA
jgi:AcrR family transcriptional regulator